MGIIPEDVKSAALQKVEKELKDRCSNLEKRIAELERIMNTPQDHGG